jgi:L-threonylcarbamoyladenylate synthase
LLSAADIDAAAAALLAPASGPEQADTPVAIYSRQPPKGWPGPQPRCTWQPMPARADACAHELFAVLRRLDAQGVRQIWVEAPPPDAAWDGVRDRLVRAAA